MRAGRAVSILHTAPWADEQMPAGVEVAPNLHRLSGDFLCAPFGKSDLESVPSHGYPANSRWDLLCTLEHGDGLGATATYLLRKRVFGATVRKELTLRDGHPFVYIRHVFEGEVGGLPVSSHAMIHFEGRGRLTWSPKRCGLTLNPPETDPSRGRSAFCYPSRFAHEGLVPKVDGGVADIRTYPADEAHEDISVLVEAPGHALGWFSAVRHEERILFLSLKNPSVFPSTVLWHSNGGRYYPPWNGRHRGVLGVRRSAVVRHDRSPSVNAVERPFPGWNCNCPVSPAASKRGGVSRHRRHATP